MNLSVDSGVSSTELDLQGLMLEKLDINAGVGDASCRFRWRCLGK